MGLPASQPLTSSSHFRHFAETAFRTDSSTTYHQSPIMDLNFLEPQTEIGLARWRFRCAHCGVAITDARSAVATHHDDGSQLRFYCRNCGLAHILRAPSWTPCTEILEALITSASQLLQSTRP